jgi:hypothetical protein
MQSEGNEGNAMFTRDLLQITRNHTPTAATSEGSASLQQQHLMSAKSMCPANKHTGHADALCAKPSGTCTVPGRPSRSLGHHQHGITLPDQHLGSHSIIWDFFLQCKYRKQVLSELQA